MLNVHSHPAEFGSDVVISSHNQDLCELLQQDLKALDLTVDLRQPRTLTKHLCTPRTIEMIDGFYSDREESINSIYISVNSDFILFDK